MLRSTLRFFSSEPPAVLEKRLKQVVEDNQSRPWSMRTGLVGDVRDGSFRLRWSHDEIEGRGVRVDGKVQSAGDGSMLLVTIKRSRFHTVLAVLAVLLLLAVRVELGLLPSLVGAVAVILGFPIMDRNQRREAVREAATFFEDRLGLQPD